MTAALAPLQVVLLDGRSVSSWSADWRAETLARHLKVGAILPLPDREARRAALDDYQRDMAAHALVCRAPVPPAEYAAEARRRLEAAILDAWRRAQPAAAAA